MLHKPSIIPNEENPKTKIYYDVSEMAFKLRNAKHKKTLSNIKYQTDTELSNEYWNIISANKTSWEILGTHKPYNQSSKRCLLFSKKSWQSLCTGTITYYKQIIRSDKQVQVQQQIYASQYDMKD